MDKKTMDCSLCHSLTPVGKTNFVNTILLETENFILMPSIGPLDLGHVLIVSKNHSECLATMGEDKIKEFQLLVEKLISKRHLFKNILFVEHGSYDGNKGGACVTHTHIHILPDYGKYYNILDGILDVSNVNFSPYDFSDIETPYILSFNDAGGLRIYEAYNVHSQMMRKAICSKLKIKNADWRTNSRKSLIYESINYWKYILKYD